MSVPGNPSHEPFGPRKGGGLAIRFRVSHARKLLLAMEYDSVPRSRRPLDDVHIPHEAAVWMRRAAFVLGIFAVAVFAVLAADRGVPRSNYFDQWEPPAQVALLAIASLGYLIAIRWPALGGVIMMQAGVFLGVLATVEYSRAVAFLASAAFLVPGTLFVLSWQRTESLRGLLGIAAGVAALLAVGAYASNQVYEYYYGPSHPESDLQAQPVDLVEWVWAGGVTDHSVTVAARLAEEHSEVRLVLAEPGSAVAMRGDAVAATRENDRIVSLTMDHLSPDTTYEYTIQADGEMEQTRRGTFRTFASGAETFSFAFSSCARTGSNGMVFDAIRALNPYLYISTGDLHYENISGDNPGAFRDAFQTVLTSPAQAALYQSVPIAYVWDDHDYGGNNADSTSDSRSAVRSVYRQAVPHYALPAGSGDAAIYQAFSVGRVRFIITDTRSERTPASAPDDENKSMLGEAQKAWFKDQLLAARDEYALVVWVEPDPWIDDASAGSDSWGGYDTERREIAAFIEDNGIDNLLMVSGDAHMLAIDDGTNSAGGFPVFHAAALDRHGREKGGPYSEGAYPDSGQFGLVTVNDDGRNEVQVILSGRNYKDEEIVHYEYTISVP
jgi:phosphodiesterase/alkaline phosphatase D-like protein